MNAGIKVQIISSSSLCVLLKSKYKDFIGTILLGRTINKYKATSKKYLIKVDKNSKIAIIS